MNTIDLTEEQLRYIERLVSTDMIDSMRVIRSRSFEGYGPVESTRMHADVRIAAALIGQILPKRPSVDEFRLRQDAG